MGNTGAPSLGLGLRSGSSHSAQLMGFSPPLQGYLCPGVLSRNRDHQTPVPRGPWTGCTGKVVVVFPDNPKKVGVCFDCPVPGGTDLGGINQCTDHHGFFCSALDLKLEGSSRAQEQEALVIDALFDVVGELAGKGPVIVVLKVRWAGAVRDSGWSWGLQIS